MAKKPVDRMAKKQGWKTIETAPRDKRVMVWSGQEMYCAHWAQNLRITRGEATSA